MEIILIIMAILLLFFTSVLMLRVSLTVEADSDVRAYLKILSIKIPLYPQKEKKVKLSDFETRRFKKKQEKERQKALRQKQKQQRKVKGKKKKEVADSSEEQKWTLERVLDILQLARTLIGKFFSKFTKHLRLDIARVHIYVASDDPAKTAMYYGLISQSVTYLVEILDCNTNLYPSNDDKKDIVVTADFLAQKTRVDIKATASLRVWQMLDTSISTIYEYVKHKYLSDL